MLSPRLASLALSIAKQASIHFGIGATLRAAIMISRATRVKILHNRHLRAFLRLMVTTYCDQTPSPSQFKIFSPPSD
jgi:hypothetical protein